MFRTIRPIVWGLFAAFSITGGAALAQESQSSPATPIPNRPRVPGTLLLHQRSRSETAPGSGQYKPVEREVRWEVADTAIIICDMWDDHYCRLAAQRLGVMAPRMNAMTSAARASGVMIIHAPSGTMDFYADTPYRRRMIEARPAEPPVPIAGWCYLDRDSEAPLPIVDSVSSCDDPVVGEQVRKYSREHPALDIAGYDGVSDSGVEIYNFCRQEGITNIAIMGVHANMCVLGRPFGIRQLTRLGMNVVLVRDMTDAMYDPRQPPYVSHTRGTELVIEHIETYWCPSVESGDLMQVIAGSADRGHVAQTTPAGPTKAAAGGR